MANRTRNILNALARDTLQDEQAEQYNKESKAVIDYYEKEKEKSDAQKTHERYRNNQKKHESAMDITELIRPAKKMEPKPGTYFYGPLKKLAEEFGDIKTMTYYMTIGQLTKYEEKNNKLYRIRTGELAYDEITKECFE
jgi:hypothetical protein